MVWPVQTHPAACPPAESPVGAPLTLLLFQGPCPGAERMVWPVQTHPAQSTGPESKRNSGDGGYFSLDFSFYRTALP
jgi:hypothetical protein